MALAEVVVADAALAVGEIVGRPVTVVEGAPDLEIVVRRDRIADAEIGDGLADVGGFALKANSGAWTPITTNPWSLAIIQART
jgi:hypothetical protein